MNKGLAMVTPTGSLMPVPGSGLPSLKPGDTVTVSVQKSVNGPMRRKYHALIDRLYGLQSAFTTREALRNWLTIQAGFYDVVAEIAGSPIRQPKSLQWGKMGDVEFHELFSKTIHAAWEGRHDLGMSVNSEKALNDVLGEFE